MSGRILVTGGTGKTATPLLRRLDQAGWATRSASRTAAQPGSVAFDWHDDQGHDKALAEVDRIYLVAPTGSQTPIDVMEPFIERALSQGVRRFVLLSSSLIDEGGPAMGAVHALLRRRAPEWAVLRPSWFMENFSEGPHQQTIVNENVIFSATDDGQVPFITAADIAETAFSVLTNEQAPNTDLLLTGSAAISYDQAAAIIGLARGRSVQHIRLSEAAQAARFEVGGVPPGFARMLAGLDRAIATGAENRTTSVVASVTGREPVSFETFAARHASVWR
ncbi:ergot alkaloid biosynthesis protein [Deinococcus sp. Arct2-2]|uniref:ergot alkaloid biosynthesis protein n=1 Tax=Deinococcus sp. Arct2-2 TaxID=2568653 RepID=UPI0010A561C6|nr:ergot alkaloid biosynthesis protein [Deinococcus sp. Arct2-2]THF68543.1 ergot alkaloid biosynthesis protein [Deinococcus sp. Arct2-2]